MLFAKFDFIEVGTYVALPSKGPPPPPPPQKGFATFCNILQHFATFCDILRQSHMSQNVASPSGKHKNRFSKSIFTEVMEEHTQWTDFQLKLLTQ